MVLKGNLSAIKREFGKNQLVLSANGISQADMEQLLRQQLADLIGVTGRTKEDVIVKLLEGITRKQLFQRLAQMDELEMEHFESYKPSLNDIFVAKAGEE